MSTASPTPPRVQTLTVMFTDLVDSTGVRVRVGEEAAERLRQRHDSVVRSAVVGHGGRVAKHTGDGVMAVFEGASDALNAAVALQQDMESANRKDPGGENLVVRVGISAGDVTVEGDDCFGLPVIEAQRLEAAAGPGHILVSALVSALGRGRGGHELRPVGPLELKGLDRPVDAEELVWESLPEEELAVVPPALALRGEFPFAGRTKEAEILSGAFAAAASGATRLVLVAGEPGIGKTRLAAEAAGAAAAKGGVVLAGRCDELVGAPHQPFGEALRFQIGRPGGTSVLGPAPGELVRLVPELADLVPGLPARLSAGADAERLRLFDAVRGWLAQLAAETPVMLVVDDLHWAEAGTLLMLRHVVVTDPVPGLLVLGTYRDTDLDRSHPLSGMLGELRRRGEVTRLSLGGLDGAEVTEMMTLAAGHELEDEGAALAVELQAETGGNPFFVGEVLRHLAESGAIVYSKGRWSAGPVSDERLLPEGIREVVGRRVSALPGPTQSALATAAVIGVEFDLELLCAVTGTPEDDLVDSLEPALTAHLVVEVDVGRFRFAHALVRSTLHGEASTTRRARLHRSVAQALESINADRIDSVAADLAYHWGEAGPATAHEQAIAYARRAAELAYQRVAPEESARWYRHARELLDGANAHLDAELACRAAQADAMAGVAGWQESLLDAARAAEAVGDVELMVEALCVSRRSVLTEDSPEAADPAKIDLLERALELASGDPRLTAYLKGALALELLFTGDAARRLALIEDVERYRDTLDDPVERNKVFRLAGRAQPLMSMPRDRLEAFVEEFSGIDTAAESAGDYETQASALLGVFYMSLWLGLPHRHRACARVSELLARYPHPLIADDALLCELNTALIDGRLTDAAATVDQITRQWIAHGRGIEARIYIDSGRTQVIREQAGLGALADRLRSMPMQPNQQGRPVAVAGLVALALVEGGRITEAHSHVEEFGRNQFSDIPDDAGRSVAEASWAEAAARCGHADACLALYELLEPKAWLHQGSGGWYLGSNARYLALLSDALGRPDEADEWFARAVEDHQRMQSPPWIARTRLDWADSLLRRGRTDEARGQAGQVLDDIGDLDLPASRARAEALMSQGHGPGGR